MAENARRLAVVEKTGQRYEGVSPRPERLAREAYRVLQVAFVLVPLIAGADKYFHLLTNWEQYVSPLVMGVLGARWTHVFMLTDGAFEILLGLGVAFRPKIFAYIVSVWLMAIVINLLTTGHYLDIALRDVGLSLASFALGKIANSLSN
jgi:hypothetical protein